MKLTTFLLFVMFFQVSAGVFSQENGRLNLKAEKESVNNILKMIEEQTEYRFLYNSNNINVERKTDINCQSKSIEEVLEMLFRGTNVKFRSFNSNYVLYSEEWNVSELSQQQKSVSGKVTDSSGAPLPGVSVVIKGTTNGIITDANGNYSLSKVPDNATLLFSFVGMKSQEVKVAGKSSVNVTLQEETIGVDEVVVVGFGTQKKMNLTGAVETISKKELANRSVINVPQALQGLVPGLNITQSSGELNTSSNIDIRGIGTIGSGSTASPLILIDGVSGSSSDIYMLNPQDIENISVLKDAAASSIYGSRAPFGVILITTKSGSVGKAQVNYNNNFRWTAPVLLPQMMDSYSFGTFMNDAAVNAGRTSRFNDERMQRIKDYMEGKITTVSIPDPSNPKMWGSCYLYANANTDFYDVYYKDWSFSQNHNFSLSGGNEKNRYYLSLGYLDQNGLLKLAKDDFQEFTPMCKVDANPLSWMQVDYTVRFARTNYTKPTDLSSTFYTDLGRQGWPVIPLYDDNGHYYPDTPVLGVAEGGTTTQEVDAFNNHASVKINPIKNWETTMEFNYNIKGTDSKSVSLKTYGYDVAENPFVKRQDSYISQSFNKVNFLNLNLYSSYNFKLNQNNNFKLLIGYQYEDLKNRYFGLARNGILIDELPVIDLTTGTDYNGKAVTPSVNGSSAEWSTAGFFGRLNYDFKEKYLFEANLRYDGTSRFRGDKRWNWFPSFSAGWNIARENFWGEISNYINTLKLRGSYGELGNQNTNSWYPTYQTVSVNMNSGTWLQSGKKTNTAYEPALISRSLTWEKVNNWDVGTDFGAFNNRLTGSFDYYVRKTLDMVGPAVELPVTLGTAVPQSNNTDLKTYGFELSLGWQQRFENGLMFGAKFILSDSQTEITRYPNKTNSLSTYYKGQKLGTIWGYETIGIAKSKEEMDNYLASLPNGGQNALGSQWAAGDIMYRDINNDEKINSGSYTLDDHGDIKIIGNNKSRYLFGLDLNAVWKGFDMRVFFQGVAKRDFWTSSDYFWGVTSGGEWYAVGLKDHLDYFRSESSRDLKENLDSYYPRPLYVGASKNQQVQTRYLQDASYIRLKNITLGYTLPKYLSEKFFVNNLRLFFTGENLWTGTKLAKMFDPETVSGGASGNGNAYPLQKTMAVGLSITL